MAPEGLSVAVQIVLSIGGTVVTATSVIVIAFLKRKNNKAETRLINAQAAKAENDLDDDLNEKMLALSSTALEQLEKVSIQFNKLQDGRLNDTKIIFEQDEKIKDQLKERIALDKEMRQLKVDLVKCKKNYGALHSYIIGLGKNPDDAHRA